MSEVIEMPQNTVAAHQDHMPANSPMGMMMAAMQQGSSLEQVEKMMDLQERWQKGEAKKAYDEAFAAFKAESIKIILRGETRLRTLIETDDRYGYHEDGYASLCHQLSPETLVWAAGGWQPELRRKYETEAATLELAGA